MKPENHLIPVWGGSMTPMNYCISLLKVDVEQERNDRYSQFQNWAFKDVPMLKPVEEVIESWVHQEKCPLNKHDDIKILIKSMVKLFEEEHPYDEWKKARLEELEAIEKRRKELESSAQAEQERSNSEGNAPSAPAQSQEGNEQEAPQG